MAAGHRGTPTLSSSTGAQTATFGSGWAAGDLHVIRLSVKNASSNVPALPSGYTEIATQTYLTYTYGRICARILQAGDIEPSLNGAGNATMMCSETFTGIASGATVSDILETYSVSVNTSSTTINYSASTIATAGCFISGLFIYGTSGSGTLGTPSTFAAPSNTIATVTGTTLKASLWTDLQTSAVNLAAGSVPITGGSSNSERSMIVIVKPTVTSTVTISDLAETYYDGEAFALVGTALKPAATDCTLKVCTADDINHVSGVAQTVSSSTNTGANGTMNLSSFPAYTNLYAFVTNSAGQSNVSGFVFQRVLRTRFSDDFTNGGPLWASQSNITYSIRLDSIRGTEIIGGTGGTTNASGVLTSSYYSLSSADYTALGGASIASLGYVWASFAQDNATLSLTRTVSAKYLLTYL